ncbi:MAG: hypothetical protein RL235_441 [Chlamydiota bacterium]
MKRIISRTPLRISFFGGGTDYPAYFCRHPGAVLGTTIDQYTYVSLNTLSDFFDHKLRISYSQIELVKTLDEIQHPSVKGCLQHKGIFPLIDVHIAADLPAKTGLGSSSSFTVGFLNALYALQGKRSAKQKLAEESCFVEQEVVKENVGSQDQFHASFGGLNIIEFTPASIRVRPVVISAEKKQLLQDHLLMYYTGMTRIAHEVVKEQIANTKAHYNDAALQRMYEMVFEAESAFSDLSGETMLRHIGALLDEGWRLKKSLSSKVSHAFIDDIYTKAIQHGAYGGKLCGAGSGGFLILLVPSDARAEVKEALKDLLEVKFRFESEGTTIIYMKE